jgi:hypothetical protein
MISKLSEYKDRFKTPVDELTFDFEEELSFCRQVLSSLEVIKPSIEKDLLKVQLKFQKVKAKLS